MRSILVGVVTLVAVSGSIVGKAQVFQLPTPAPKVTANADWQLRGDPVFFAGDFYYPTGPTVFFDGSVMVRSGIYQGVPLYVETTMEPYTVVYVPIGRNLMRPYERRRGGELAGTAATLTPSFPIERDAERSVSVAAAPAKETPVGEVDRDVVPEAGRPVGTGSKRVSTKWAVGTAGAVRPGGPATPSLQSIPAPRSNAGIWLEFNGAQWYSSGSAVPLVAGRFVQIGTYRGFPVYRDETRRSGEIYVPSVDDGPLAPYSRR
jgi:hypothetical protein